MTSFRMIFFYLKWSLIEGKPKTEGSVQMVNWEGDNTESLDDGKLRTVTGTKVIIMERGGNYLPGTY